jgi:hypothetical protein
MWAITEYGTKEHVIRPRRKQAVVAPGYGAKNQGVFAYVTQKARAQYVWARAEGGFDQAQLQRIIDARYAKAMGMV